MIINLNISHPPAIRFSPIFTFSRAVLTHTLTLQFLFLSCVCPFFGVYFVFLFMPPSTLDFWFYNPTTWDTDWIQISTPFDLSEASWAQSYVPWRVYCHRVNSASAWEREANRALTDGPKNCKNKMNLLPSMTFTSACFSIGMWLNLNISGSHDSSNFSRE